MEIRIRSSLTEQEQEEVYRIWNSVFPGPAVFKNKEAFRNYLAGAADPTHFILTAEDKILGWLMTFHRNDERNFVLLLDEGSHGKGLGSTLLKAMQEKENRVSGWVVPDHRYLKANGSPYLSPAGFYFKHGFVQAGDPVEKDNFLTVKVVWGKDASKTTV